MLKPFLKWAGGKRWLINNGTLPQSIEFNKYYEPFLGSGAVFFFLQPQKARLSDINPDLIELYEVIRDEPKDFSELLNVHHKNHCKAYYYRIRSDVPGNRLDKAARLLYLNRTCWNGLYRVNTKGEFNVPIGTKTSVLLETDDFLTLSDVLNRVDLICSDFEESIDLAIAGDFLFIDPPYTVQHNNNNFLKYNENIFGWDDQVRLRNAIVRAKNRGVKALITNADHPSIIELYKGVGDYCQLNRSSVLAGKKEKRGRTTEAMFLTNIQMGNKGE